MNHKFYVTFLCCSIASFSHADNDENQNPELTTAIPTFEQREPQSPASTIELAIEPIFERKEETTPQIQTTSVSENIKDYLKSTSTIGLCSMSCGFSLLVKRHPIIGGLCIAAGSMCRINPTQEDEENENKENVVSGAELIRDGVRSLAKGLFKSARITFETIERLLEK